MPDVVDTVCLGPYTRAMSKTKERDTMNSNTVITFTPNCDECGAPNAGYPIHGGEMIVCVECA